MPFRDRTDAGLQLARALSELDLPDPVVVGLPRGGLVLAAEVAGALGAPLDVVVVRKVRDPANPALALGAVGESGIRVSSRPLLEEAGVDEERFEQLAANEEVELRVQLERYRTVRPAVPLDGRVVVVVDDGLTTGASASVAATVVRGRDAVRVILAVPVSPPEAAEAVRARFDEVVCLETPELMLSLDEWYADLPDVTDDEVVALLAGG
jgi:predicted phosphoribosyltransferase